MTTCEIYFKYDKKHKLILIFFYFIPILFETGLYKALGNTVCFLCDFVRWLLLTSGHEWV